jgi:hypothetical protein
VVFFVECHGNAHTSNDDLGRHCRCVLLTAVPSSLVLLPSLRAVAVISSVRKSKARRNATMRLKLHKLTRRLQRVGFTNALGPQSLSGARRFVGLTLPRKP